MNVPNAEKILSLLVDLYADQHNVKIKYHIAKQTEGGFENGNMCSNDFDNLHHIDRIIVNRQ